MPRTDSRGIPYAAQLLARLRTCLEADVPVSRELLKQVIAAFESDVSKRALKCKRNKLIRRAGLLAAGTGNNAPADELAAQARALQRQRVPVSSDGIRRPAATVRECLREAAIYGRLPQSPRQFNRILDSHPHGD